MGVLALRIIFTYRSKNASLCNNYGICNRNKFEHLTLTGMTKRQTTTNYRKSPQTTTNHRKKPKTTTHHRKPPQITTIIWDIGSETRDDAGKPPQTTTRIWADGYSCAGKKQLFCLSYGSFKLAKPCWWSTMLLRIPIIPNPAYLRCFSGGLWWFEAACLVGKPPQITTEMP